MKHDTDRTVLGARLREAREYRGYSQDDVAKYLDLPRPAISLLESGTRRLEALELKKLANLYGCSMDELTDAPATETEPESVRMLARAAAKLSAEDQTEVLRFAQFLRSQKARKQQ